MDIIQRLCAIISGSVDGNEANTAMLKSESGEASRQIVSTKHDSSSLRVAPRNRPYKLHRSQ